MYLAMSEFGRIALTALLLIVATPGRWVCDGGEDQTGPDSLSPDSAEALLKVGAWDSAIEEYQRLVSLQPEWGEVHRKLGYSYFRKGDYEKAIASLTRAIELEPNDFISYAYRGTAYYKTGNYHQGLSDLQTSISIDPGFALSYYFLGSLYLAWGRHEEALTQFDKFCELGAPFSPRHVVYSKRGKAHLGSGNYFDAIADFTKALELRGDHASGYYHRGLAYWKADSTDQALSDYNRALTISPQYAQAYYDRAETHLVRGDTVKAVNDLKKCLGLSRNAELRDRAEARLQDMEMGAK